ncbi:MAG TPA: hypothetical protein GX708_22105 [Gallicola sp.]|nr:hypothetical protein [Gallicola sp.]
MKEKLRLYIEENLELFKERQIFSKNKSMMDYDACLGNIDSYIDQNKDENKFQTLLFKLIDERNLKDSDVYNKVHLDRRLFSKIRSDSNYHPSKETVILLGLALELNEKEIINLLESSSYTLPKNNHYDLIIRFCFSNNIHKLNEVNELLSSYNCKLIN